MVWGPEEKMAFDGSATLRMTTVLNNSDNSQLGMGTFLYGPAGYTMNFPEGSYRKVDLHNPIAPELSYRTRYVMTIHGLHDIEAMKQYGVVLYTADWSANEDNAETSIEYLRAEEGCERLCNYDYENCRLYNRPWGVAPIPGKYDWPDLRDQQYCHTGTLYWLPAILGSGGIYK